MNDTGIDIPAGADAGSSNLVVAAGAATSASDRSFDLSLRLLTALVTVALAASVSLLLYRWLAPRLAHYDTEPVATRASHAAPPPKTTDVNPTHVDEVLMDPGRVFKCEDQGRVSFSDQACGSASPGTAGSAAAERAKPATPSAPQ